MAKPPEVKPVIKARLLSGPLKTVRTTLLFKLNHVHLILKNQKKQHTGSWVVWGFVSAFCLLVFKDWYIQTSKLLISPIKHSNSPWFLPLLKFYFSIPLSFLSYPIMESPILTSKYNWKFQTTDKKKISLPYLVSLKISSKRALDSASSWPLPV